MFTWLFYHPKWNFISVKMTYMKSIPAVSFKRTCALNAISNASALIQFVSGKFCSHKNLIPVWNFISVKVTDMKSIPFWQSWLNTEVRFSTEMKSHTDLSSFRLSCERTLNNWNISEIILVENDWHLGGLYMKPDMKIDWYETEKSHVVFWSSLSKCLHV